MSAGCACAYQHTAVGHVSALSAWSLVFLRINRFVQAEGTVTVAPASVMTASKARLVSFALPAPACAPCTGSVIFVVLENEVKFQMEYRSFLVFT